MGANSNESPWRLGTIARDGSPTAVLEIADQVFLLDDLLGAAGRDSETATTVLAMLQEWDRWEADLTSLVQSSTVAPTAASNDVQWLPPILYPPKLIVCGGQYADRLAEIGVDPSDFKNPYTSFKPSSTSPVGDRAPIVIPSDVSLIDWEVELGVVIGRRVRNASLATALDAVAGYCVTNDVSVLGLAGSIPVVGLDWTLVKGFDGLTPMGPITPARFVADPQSLRLQLSINGEPRQDGSTADMIFTVAEVIVFISSVMTLEPGDVLLTGSPGGGVNSTKPPQRLGEGDQITASIEGLGSISNAISFEQTESARGRAGVA